MDIPDLNIRNDIQIGLVLHLDPLKLKALKATCSVPENLQVDGNHFFICLSLDGENSTWTPLYTNSGFERTQISTQGRTGHDKWTKGRFHYHPAQKWTATSDAVMYAAHAAKDLSRHQTRNRLDPAHVPVP